MLGGMGLIEFRLEWRKMMWCLMIEVVGRNFSFSFSFLKEGRREVIAPLSFYKGACQVSELIL